ncbi:hypothetical protein PIB30_090936 [Stylosanthes scabra]|uniref:Uncharacterized protein n=1 Tax=Stylosanthes scabra TaxID=79078 RepID=A0ABU6RUC5_9FABA|nr:hypothetical protein [Stylosanthes scabra]
MGMEGCTWMLKRSGGTAFACFELGIQEVNEGIHGVNFPAFGNSGLSVVKGCSRNTHVVKYRHMMTTWKLPIMILSKRWGVM